jgi:ADP-ribose pyrophosphatase YjhB (NUDIX family)
MTILHYCYHCGSQLETLAIDNHQRKVCPKCGSIHYDQLKVTAGILLEIDSKVLLVKRAINPFKGYWYLPSGFLEADETPIMGALRELHEETGLMVKVTRLANVYYYDDDPRGNGILILFHGKWIGGKISSSLESDGCSFFSKDETNQIRLAGMAHQAAIEEWKVEKNV